MAQITMDKKALLILGVVLAFLGLALFAAGLFSGLLLREAGTRPDGAVLERRLADMSNRLDVMSRALPAPAEEPKALAEPPAPAPAKAEPPAPAPAPAEPPAPAPAPAPAEPPARYPSAIAAGYVVQTGAFTVKMNAVNQAERLKEKGYDPVVVEVKGKGDRVWHVVRLMGYAGMEEAQRSADGLLERDGIKAVAMEADFPMSPTQEEAAAAEAAPAQAAEPSPAPAPPPASGVTRHSVQVSSFRDESDARTTLRSLANRGFTPCIVVLYDSQERPWFTVQLGDYASRDEASRAGEAYRAATGGSYVVKPYDENLLAQRRRCP